MKKIFNTAVVGCGAISAVHLDAISSFSGAKLVAVCDIDGRKASNAAQKHGCTAYTDYSAMLQNSDIDVVHICTPHYLHAPMAIEAMKDGKHVLVEKPIATRVCDAGEMMRVSSETGRRLGVCFQNRYNATSSRIKQLLESGSAGRVCGAKAFVTWHRDEKYYTESGWRGTWEKEGGGVLINQSIHTLDLLQWLLGDIDKIKANVDTRLLQDAIEVEDTADAVIKFKSGATALFYATNCYTIDSPVELEIVCEKAVIKLAGELTVRYENGETEHIHETDMRTGQKAYWGCGHAVLIEDYYDSLAEGREFPIDGGQAVKALEIIQAIYKSSKSREYARIEVY